MTKVLEFLKALGAAVDKAVPWALGARTKVAVVACPLLGYAKPFVPAKYAPVVDLAQGALCSAAPLFAAAGLVRDKK